MGHPEKGASSRRRGGVPRASCAAGQRYYCPNLVELEILRSSGEQRQRGSCRRAIELIAQGPEVVLVKHLARAGLSMDRFEMLLVTAEAGVAYQSAAGGFRPASAGGRWRCDQRRSAGETASGGRVCSEALEHVTAAVYEIMLTKEMQEYELQVVAAQDRIAKPEHCFSATRL